MTGGGGLGAAGVSVKGNDHTVSCTRAWAADREAKATTHSRARKLSRKSDIGNCSLTISIHDSWMSQRAGLEAVYLPWLKLSFQVKFVSTDEWFLL